MRLIKFYLFFLISLGFVNFNSFASDQLTILDFPSETQVAILTYVPEESLTMNICKQWNALTSIPQIRFRIFENYRDHNFTINSEEDLALFINRSQPHYSLKFRYKPSSWAFLSKLTDLKNLTVSSYIKISPSSLSSLSKLEKLDLVCENLTHPSREEGCNVYCELPRLKSLYIKDDDLSSDAAHSWIASLTELESLYIIGSNLGSKGGKTLAFLTKLTKLHADWNDLGSSVSYLSTLTDLTDLNISHNYCTRASLETLSTLQNLKLLSMAEIGRKEEIEEIAAILKNKIPGLAVSTD